jgi:integrase
MPRLTNTFPAYRHHKASGQAVVTLSGKDHYLGVHGTAESRAEYDRLIAEWLAGGRRLAPARDEAPPDLSVTELVRDFLRWAEEDYRPPDGSPSPELGNLKLALKPLKAMFGPVSARDFGPLRLQTLQQALAKSGLCRRTVNQRIKRVVRVFAWAESQELIPRGQHHALRTVRGLKAGRSEARESKVVRPVPDDVVAATLPYLSRQLQAVVALQQATGMRSSEVLSMRTGDIDRSGKTWIYSPRKHKGQHHGRERLVFLGPRAQEILAAWLRADPDAYLFSPAEAEKERRGAQRAARKTPMTPSQRARKRKQRPQKAPGDYYDARAYGHAVRAACRQAFPHPVAAEFLAGIAATPRGQRRALRAELNPWKAEHLAEIQDWNRKHAWHPHQLRHGVATRLRREFGLDAAKIILGHSSLDTAMIYAEADRQRAIQVVEQVG